MDWLSFAMKLPMIVSGTMSIVNKVKDAPKEQKKAAVLAAVPESVQLVDFAAGRDLLNDAVIAKLLQDVVDAEALVADARAALKQGILTHPATATDPSRVH